MSKNITYLLSKPPFLSVCIREAIPFSCLKVTNSSTKKSRAIPSLIKCSLLSTNKTLGGTEPLTVIIIKK